MKSLFFITIILNFIIIKGNIWVNHLLVILKYIFTSQLLGSPVGGGHNWNYDVLGIIDIFISKFRVYIYLT